MKKVKVCTALALLMLSFSAFCGCVSLSSQNKNPFSVFEGDFTAELDVSVSGSQVGLTCERQGASAKLTINSPSNISGYSFLLGADKTMLKFGDVETVATGRMLFLPELITSLFTSRCEEITEIKAEKTEGGTFTVVKTPSITFRFDGSGAPACVEGIINGADVKITVKGFSVSTPSEEQRAS